MKPLWFTNAILTCIAVLLAFTVVQNMSWRVISANAQNSNTGIQMPPQAVWIVGSSTTLPVYMAKDPSKAKK